VGGAYSHYVYLVDAKCNPQVNFEQVNAGLRTKGAVATGIYACDNTTVKYGGCNPAIIPESAYTNGFLRQSYYVSVAGTNDMPSFWNFSDNCTNPQFAQGTHDGAFCGFAWDRVTNPQGTARLSALTPYSPSTFGVVDLQLNPQGLPISFQGYGSFSWYAVGGGFDKFSFGRVGLFNMYPAGPGANATADGRWGVCV